MQQFKALAYQGGEFTLKDSESAFKALEFKGFNESGFDLNQSLTNSSYFETYLESLNGSQKFNSYMSAIESSISGPNIIAQVKVLEQSIINDEQNLSAPEYTALLVGTSIARYSSDYWGNNIDDWAPNAKGVLEDIIKNDVKVGVGTAIAVGVFGGPAAPGAVPSGIAAGFGASAATGLWYGGKWVLKQVGDNTGWWNINWP